MVVLVVVVVVVGGGVDGVCDEDNVVWLRPPELLLKAIRCI